MKLAQMVHECSLDSVEYRSGLCNPSVRPGTVWYLWMVMPSRMHSAPNSH